MGAGAVVDDRSDSFELLGRTIADKYRVEQVVAKGGFGTVYRARHVELDTAVAIKVLMVPERFDGALRAEFLEMFKREARTIAALSHPSIVRVLDFGAAELVTGETPWMALEWLEGRTLEADLESRPDGAARSPREALELLRPAFDALACAHHAGIAHRDIKPANLMIVKARRGEAGLRVLDFGIAKVMVEGEQAGSGQTATVTEIASYSLFYAAPEQVSRARSGPWTDVHAVALILVELLTARRAYRGAEVYVDILDRDRPTPARFGVDVGPWEVVIVRALALRPDERYPDADALLAALESSVELADAAWRNGRARASAAAATAPASRGPTPATPPALPAAVTAPVPRRRWWIPVAAGAALGVLAVVAWAAATPAVAVNPVARVAPPTPPPPLDSTTLPLDSPTPPPVVVAALAAPAVAAIDASRAEVHARRGRGHPSPVDSAPGPVAPTSVAAPPVAPTPTPVIVIE